MKIWRLAKGKDRRFRQGHPWIFTSELAHSSKEVRPGEVVELRDNQERFLAYGYAHPRSQICFRRLSSRAKETDLLSERFFVERLRAARILRQQAGWAKASHRWLFAEADGIPGLVIDAFATDQGWIAVVQASTAGIESALPQIFQALISFAKELGDIAIVECPTSGRRQLEGLALGPKKQVAGTFTADLKQATLHLREGLRLRADLLNGQKTGFFLDQQANVSVLLQLVRTQFAGISQRLRVLDICCYVGQWGAHLTHELSGRTEVTLVDTSNSALSLAAQNIMACGGTVQVVQGDALIKLGELPEGQFDIVICDPPAFVKKKVDLEPGLKAYVKLNRDAMRAVKQGGLFVASSCSALVKGDDWNQVLLQAGSKAGRLFKQLSKTGHAPDHPTRPEFPEGEYLNCVTGRIDYPY